MPPPHEVVAEFEAALDTEAKEWAAAVEEALTENEAGGDNGRPAANRPDSDSLTAAG